MYSYNGNRVVLLQIPPAYHHHFKFAPFQAGVARWHIYATIQKVQKKVRLT